MSVIGKKNMNLPMMPGQNANGKNGESVVSVPVNTGTNTSPVAIFAAFLIGTFPLSKIRCVFSITTIASSTTIPNARRKLNNTIMFKEKPIPGKIKNARNTESGTESATKNALVTPIKNINTINTNRKPMMMVFIKSCSVVLVDSL